MTFRVLLYLLYNRFLAFSWGPGGFRELREACRKHFHPSWYLSDAVVTSYDQKPSWGNFFYRARSVTGLFCTQYCRFGWVFMSSW